MDAVPADDVDPKIREWLTRMSAASAALGSRPGLPAPERRAIAEKQREPWRSGGPVMADTKDLRVGSGKTRIRIHRPDAAGDLPVLVYLHGGGWTLFSIDTHDRLMREYAARAGCAVLGVDYPLAPENPYPAGLHAIVEVLDWLQSEGSACGLDPARYVLGGDSAGANLSMAAAIMQRDAGRAMPCGLLLNYGAFDIAAHPSYSLYGDGDRYMLTGAEMDDFWRTYLGMAEGADLSAIGADDLLEPLHAGLEGLPAAFLCIAECDILRDENLLMARRLGDAGVGVEAQVYEGATHSFLEAARIAPLADRALADASCWLARTLDTACAE